MLDTVFSQALAAYANKGLLKEVPIQFVDSKNLSMTSYDGRVFEELEDNSWIEVTDEGFGNIRYWGTVSHGGGVGLKSVYVKVGDSWHHKTTGSRVSSYPLRAEARKYR